MPDKNHIAAHNDAKTKKEDEEQAAEAAKLRPERAAKVSDYYVSILPYRQSCIAVIVQPSCRL